MHSPIELAEAFLEAGEVEDALAALDQHLADHVGDDDAQRLRVRVLLALKRGKDALAGLDALATGEARDHLLRAQAYTLLGDPERALEANLQAAQQGSNEAPESVEILLGDLYRSGKSDEALALLADLDKSWRWLGWSGDFLALRGDYAAAEAHYCSAIDQLKLVERSAIIETQKAYLLLKRAEVYRRLRRFADADADYHAAEVIIPNDPTIPFNRGLLVFEQGSLRRALPLCRDAMDQAPDALRDHMRDILMDEPRYHLLAQALLS